jgi:hypothetical protein
MGWREGEGCCLTRRCCTPGALPPCLARSFRTSVRGLTDVLVASDWLVGDPGAAETLPHPAATAAVQSSSATPTGAAPDASDSQIPSVATESQDF